MTELSLENGNATRSPNERVAYAALLLLSLGAVAAVQLCTWRYGIGTSPDSSNYIAAARSLLAGEGLRYADGRIYTHWPPLYPALLAMLGLAGIDPMIGARLLNAFAFGATIFVSGALLARCTTSSAFALLGALAVAMSPALLTPFTMAWSEPVFILLAALFLLVVPHFLRRKRLPVLVLVAIIAGLACLQRYAGVTFVLAGAVLVTVGTTKTPIFKRGLHLLIFGLISVTPLALWLARNMSIEGHATGSHHVRLAPAHELWRTFLVALEVSATRLSRGASPDKARLLAVGLTVLLVAVVVIARHTRTTRRDRTGWIQIGCAAVFGLTYLGFVVASAAGLSWDPNLRILMPVYVPVVLLAIAAMEDMARLFGRLLRHEQAGMALGLGLCALWPAGSYRVTSAMVRDCAHDGAGGYSVSLWHESAVIGWLRTHDLPGTYYSNAPDVVYLLTGTRTTISPHSDQGVAEYARRMVVTPPTYLVWCDNLRRDYLYDLRELLSRYETEEVASLPDGKVYRVLGEGGPPVSKVYRFWSSKTQRHLYTLKESERQKLTRSDRWTCEGPIFYAWGEQHPPGARAVHRFWSAGDDAHFYTMSEAEKDALLAEHGDTWIYEGVAFYAYPEGPQDGMIPVYHLRSDRHGGHFYTASERERDKLMTDGSQQWRDEGIAWYAYGAP